MGGNSTTLAQIHFIYNFHRDEYASLFGPLPDALDPTSSEAARFPATGNPNINRAIGQNGASFIAAGAGPKFNASDNAQFFARFDDSGQPYVNAVRRMQAMMGDTNYNGWIDNGETAAYNGSYILWAAGPDGFYGPKSKDNNAPLTQTIVSKCDDIIVTP